jgi:hypothetical protein
MFRTEPIGGLPDVIDSWAGFKDELEHVVHSCPPCFVGRVRAFLRRLSTIVILAFDSSQFRGFRCNLTPRFPSASLTVLVP